MEKPPIGDGKTPRMRKKVKRFLGAAVAALALGGSPETLAQEQTSKKAAASSVEHTRRSFERVAIRLRDVVAREMMRDSDNGNTDHALLALGDYGVFQGLSFQDWRARRGKHFYSSELGTYEFHKASLAYAMMRSRAYDRWKKIGGAKFSEAKKILDQISHPLDYGRGKTDNIPILKGGHDYEWIMGVWIELAKRGVAPHFNRGAIGYPFSLDELYRLNEEELDFVRKPEALGAYNKDRIERVNATCEGMHALHALVAYDVYFGNEDALNAHLEYGAEALKKILAGSIEGKDHKQIEKILHDLSHTLTTFTELPPTFDLEDMKEVVSDALEHMVALSEEYEKEIKIASRPPSISTLSHIIDVLEHFSPELVKE